MNIRFVRHGQTNYNILDLCNDDPSKDVHLTKLGKQQAEQVKTKLSNIKFDAVYISELPRTRETAEIITGNQKITFQVEPRLNDRKTGFDSKPASDFFNAIKSDIFNLRLNGGESFQEEKNRIYNFLEELKKTTYQTILVVAHSETLQIVNGFFHNLSDEEMWKIKIDNCEVLEFEC